MRVPFKEPAIPALLRRYADILKWPDMNAYVPRIDNVVRGYGESEAPFHMAIRSNPFDQAPRLVYTDWLRERDDSRAEKIAECRGDWDFIPMAQYGNPSTWVNAHFGTMLREGGGWLVNAAGLGVCWIGTSSKFFQSIREGLFLICPIQTVVFLDYMPAPTRGDFYNWYRSYEDMQRGEIHEYPLNQVFGVDYQYPTSVICADLWPFLAWEPVTAKYGSAMLLRYHDVDSSHFSISLGSALVALSCAAVRLGRAASGLDPSVVPTKDREDAKNTMALAKEFGKYVGFVLSLVRYSTRRDLASVVEAWKDIAKAERAQ